MHSELRWCCIMNYKKAAISLMAVFITVVYSNKIAAQEIKPSVTSNYSNAFGIRLGGTTGITFKHSLNSNNSIEFILGAFPYSFGLTGLYERNYQTKIDGLSLYYGVGGHISRVYTTTWYYYNTDNNRYAYFRTYGYGAVWGIDFIGGAEYKFHEIPLAISFDLKPFMEFYSRYGPYINLDPGVGLKLTF